MSDPANTLEVGIIGPGKAGTALARLALAAGHRVRVAGAPGREGVQMILDVVAPGAREVGIEQLVTGSDLIILTVPFGKSRQLPYEALTGRIVVDAMNYWPPTDGTDRDAEEAQKAGMGTSEVISARNPAARWVKSLNHLGYHDMDDHARPASDPGRRTLAVAGDDSDAKALVAAFIDSIGFDPVDISPLSAGRILQPGTPIFGRELTRDQLTSLLAA